MDFASWLHYCSDVTNRRPTKLCMMFGRLLLWYTIYIYFWGLLPPGVILPVQNSLVSKSCVLLCWQHYCSAFQQRDQLNFAALSRGRHLYSAGWPSHWAYVHILVAFHLSWCTFKQQLVSLRMHRYVIVSDKLQRKSCYRESEISWEWRYHCTSYISREA